MKKWLIFSILIMFGIFNLNEPVLAEAGAADLTSEAAVLMDTQSGAILFGKNEEVKMYPASLTKIATAIYAIEKGNLDDQVIVSKKVFDIDGTRVYLNPGEQVTLKKLIQGMLINSGNDAAMAIAIHLDGTMEKYSQHVNEFLESEIGVKATHFVNPHGLFDEDHYTTAKDLGIILNYAMKNEDFREIFGTKQMKWDGESWDTTLLSHHRMLKGEIPYPGVTGGKTGFVDQSKQTLATTAENGPLKLTAILLKSEYKKKIYDDTIKLFDYGFSNFKSSQVKKGEVFTSGKRQFTYSADTFLTDPIDEGNRTVDSNGVLNIENREGKVIQTVELKPIIKKKLEVKNTAQKAEQSGVLSLNSIVGGILLLFAVGVLVLNRKQKRNRRYRSR
ncbi:D-alanyl-D-alanine carboxypeptidase family protein [Heyndrickxia sp. MSNUG]|uniref:D-alanyl-D-alanine carboxypeptidase family protein n=1 Tax=Heyndrickxia sp. MSNUG TaxID=3136677 RepID=UPI003C2EB508